MTHAFSSFRRIAVAVGLLAAASAPAHAERNRLLPFWGQPYPSGYAWTAADLRDRETVPCRPPYQGRPVIDAGGGTERCEVVLHARD